MKPGLVNFAENAEDKHLLCLCRNAAYLPIMSIYESLHDLRASDSTAKIASSSLNLWRSVLFRNLPLERAHWYGCYFKHTIHNTVCALAVGTLYREEALSPVFSI
jgi:hypothetical protein